MVLFVGVNRGDEPDGLTAVTVVPPEGVEADTSVEGADPTAATISTCRRPNRHRAGLGSRR